MCDSSVITLYLSVQGGSTSRNKGRGDVDRERDERNGDLDKRKGYRHERGRLEGMGGREREKCVVFAIHES